VRLRLNPIYVAPIVPTIFAVALYLVVRGCNPIHNVGDPDKPLAEYHPDRPFLFVHRDTGLVMAIYPDGRVIRATSESTVGESYIRGRLSPQDVAQARRILHDSGLLSTKPGGWVVLHSDVECVGVRYGERITSWAHSPGFENTNDSSNTNPRINQLKKELLALPVQEPKPEPSQEWNRYPTEFYEGRHTDR
jgi:hypothetical protein